MGSVIGGRGGVGCDRAARLFIDLTAVILGKRRLPLSTRTPPPLAGVWK